MRLLERSIDAAHERLVLLAPPNASTYGHFRQVEVDPGLHRAMLRGMQRLRGSVYLADGAITREQLSRDGLHQTPEDDQSWHLLVLDDRQAPVACVWYLEHDERVTTIPRLRVRHCPLAEDEQHGIQFRAAIDQELARARRNRMRFAEMGGWAVSAESRCTSVGLTLALATFSLGRIAGGAVGLTTATVRHASSAILRRLGGSSLSAFGAPIPPYYDQRYQCQMELLRFDSRRPNHRYAYLIEMLRARLAYTPVIASTALEEYSEVASRPMLAVSPAAA